MSSNPHKTNCLQFLQIVSENFPRIGQKLKEWKRLRGIHLAYFNIYFTIIFVMSLHVYVFESRHMCFVDIIVSTVPSSPLALSVSTVPGSPNQLSASWSPPIPKNGIIIAYTIYCNTSASQAYPEQVIRPNVPTVRSEVNGTTLAVTFSTNPYTQYDCYVTANTSVGEGTPSPIITTITAESGRYMQLLPLIMHKSNPP